MNIGLLQNMLINSASRPIDKNYLIGVGEEDNNYYIGKPQFDIKIKGDVNWDKKYASLSLEFKLSFI